MALFVDRGAARVEEERAVRVQQRRVVAADLDVGLVGMRLEARQRIGGAGWGRGGGGAVGRAAVRSRGRGWTAWTSWTRWTWWTSDGTAVVAVATGSMVAVAADGGRGDGGGGGTRSGAFGGTFSAFG